MAKTGFEAYLRKAFDVVLSPGRGTNKAMDIRGSLRFYYNIMIIPLILGVLITLLIGGPAAAGLNAVAILVILPLSVLVNSIVYHLLIGRLFGMYTQDYERVFGAFTYGIVPVVLVYWFIGIPIIGAVIVALASVWGYIVQIIALSNLLRMSRLRAFATTILSAVVVFIIVTLLSAITTVGIFAGMHVLGL